MSIKVMNWVWECSRTVGNDRLVLLAIADRANDEGVDAWPAIRSLAKKTNLHKRTVQRCVQNVEALGELTVQRQEGPFGTNVYAIRMDALVLQESSRPKRRRGPKGDNLSLGDKLSPGGRITTSGVALSPPGGGAVATGGVALPSPNTSYTSRTSSTSKSRTALARDPADDGNYKIIERLAFQLVAQGFWEEHGERFLIETEADLVAAVKKHCAKHMIDYGNHPAVANDVVHRACASEWFKHCHPRRVGRKEAIA